MGYQPVTFDEGDLKKIFRTDTPMSKFLRLLKKLTRSVVYLAAVFIVSFYLINLSAFWNRMQYNYDKLPTVAVTAPEPTPTPTPVITYSPEIVIDKISAKAPIIFPSTAAQIETELTNGVVYFPGTALPAQSGNFVLVGHSSDYPWKPGIYKNIFALLDKLVVGDKITIAYETQKLTYEVTGFKIVKPTEVSVLKKTTGATLTLITCYPVGSTRTRYIVTAKMTSGEITGTQATDPVSGSLPTPR